MAQRPQAAVREAVVVSRDLLVGEPEQAQPVRSARGRERADPGTVAAARARDVTGPREPYASANPQGVVERARQPADRAHQLGLSPATPERERRAVRDHQQALVAGLRFLPHRCRLRPPASRIAAQRRRIVARAGESYKPKTPQRAARGNVQRPRRRSRGGRWSEADVC